MTTIPRPKPTSLAPWLDVDQPLDQRVELLLAELTVGLWPA
jgi:hypothetical protein